MAAHRWREGWVAWRNRLLSDARFQRWAAGFPLTRGIANRRATALFDVVAGFVYSQVLTACVELGLLERLLRAPTAAAELAEDLSLPLESAERLLAAAAALGLAERVGDGRFALGPQGAALLGNAGLKDMIAHHALLYADLADSVGVLRRGRGELARFWPYAEAGGARAAAAEAVSAYSALMTSTQPAVAAEILHAYDVRRHKSVLDVGGGEGAFLAAAGADAPKLGLILFDLPAVCERAQRHFESRGLSQRATAIGGDFLTDPIPRGADLMTLVRIVHDQSDQGALTLLRNIRSALPSEGALLVAEPMSGAPKADRVADAYFGMYLLAMGRGRARTPAEIVSLLREAGFGHFRRLRTRTPSLLSIIVARR